MGIPADNIAARDFVLWNHRSCMFLRAEHLIVIPQVIMFLTESFKFSPRTFSGILTALGNNIQELSS